MINEEMQRLISRLESNPPAVYAKCMANIPNKKGKVEEKKCILNLTTGDIFRNRKLAFFESYNYKIVRRYNTNLNGYRNDLANIAYDHARVVDDKIVIARWIFGDHINYPETSDLNTYWYYTTSEWLSLVNAKQYKLYEPGEYSAVANISLSKPKVAAMVVINQDKSMDVWEDVAKYGLMDCNGQLWGEIYLAHNLQQRLFSVTDVKDVVGLVECFQKYFEIGYVGANRYVTFDNYKNIPIFMKAPLMQKKSGKFQTRIDDLARIELPNHNHVDRKGTTICYADRVNEEYVVLRWYMQIKPNSYIETSRMYVNKTEALRCCSDLHGNWIGMQTKIKSETLTSESGVIYEYPKVFEGTKLKYFVQMTDSMDNESAALYMLTMYPEFEKMYKLGMEWLCDGYINDTYQPSWKNYLELRVGHIDWTATSIFKMLGINRHQLDSVKKFYSKMRDGIYHSYWLQSYLDGIIKHLKAMFCVDSLNSIDDQTFDYVLHSLTEDRVWPTYIDAVKRTYAAYQKDAIYFIKDLNSIWKAHKVEIVTSHGMTRCVDTDVVYRDVMRMINQGMYMNTIRPRFSTFEELISYHDILVDLINADEAKNAARMMKQYEYGFEKHTERWKRWEWDEDEMFCVLAPTAPIDVAAEGITLRHCVKSYIPLLSDGSTNIMFIRRKSNKSEPFFTVEIDNHDKIRQIHGMCNRNADSVECLPEFVEKWSKAKKLKYNDVSANRTLAAG